ncbi:AAA family ATPase [Roseibium sp. FZY0029]|uniref:AAA family ATPase n=1 Tax=Roseibium sp. FZY0029 TaxID=3116647 RepID=UPI002EC2AB0D|nr:AAA family ATPase [Roseibium sp. FZY0029]
MKRSNLIAGTGRSVGLLMARMAVRRALRECPELLYRTAYILGAELPNDVDTTLFERAFELEFQSHAPDGPGRTTAPEFHYFIEDGGRERYRRNKPFEEFSLGKSITENQRLIAIGTPKHPLSEAFRTIAEAIVVVRPEQRHLQAAIKIARDFHLSDEIASELITSNISNLSIAFRGNRPLDAALRIINALGKAEQTAQPIVDVEGNAPSLDDIAGYGEAKSWGLELAQDLRDWKNGALQWSDVDRGVLLLGAPGTGKTVFARSLAKSCDAHFVECSLTKNQALGHLGDMLKGLSKAFNEARKNSPSVLFIDEFDGIGNRATLSRHAPEYATQVITGLLELMDGTEKRNGVVVVAACNRIETVDAAFLRPGRLERIIEIPLPDLQARKAIFKQHLQTDPPETILDEVGLLTEGCSGADLERLARDCRRSARRSGGTSVGRHVLNVLSDQFLKVPSSQLRRNAVHEAGHAVAAYAIRGIVATELVIREYFRTTNVAESRDGGYTVFSHDHSSFQVRSDYEDRIAVFLAGHAAEAILFDHPSDGSGLVAGSDLERATMIAARLIASSGIYGDLVFRADLTMAQLKRMVRDDEQFAKSCDLVLKAQMRRVRGLLASNMKQLEDVANALVKKGRLSREEISPLVQSNTNTI